MYQVRVQEKVPVQIRCFSINGDIKLMVFLILFEYEHAKSVIFHIFPHAFPPMTYSCSRHGVDHSARKPSHKEPPPLRAISQYIHLAGFLSQFLQVGTGMVTLFSQTS